jgi:hypothetical protein
MRCVRYHRPPVTVICRGGIAPGDTCYDRYVPSLMSSGDGPVARCKMCGGVAVGPCARCRSPVCGDCCELTEGGATIFAVCHACVKRGGATLAPGWQGLLAWLAAIVIGLVVIAALLIFLRG